jgi:lipopolysaccharide/colanic/teichoic acid biosynthesis glycosyltransferase
MIVISIFIKSESNGAIFFRQSRVGKGGKVFRLFKFRSMSQGAEKKGLITIGTNDNRITKTGTFIRKYKLDEIPQLINVLKGEMSIVGPRPEVEYYVEMYNVEQRKVLKVKPGITDWASIKYINENELLATSMQPEKLYIEVVMPDKLKINGDYIDNSSFLLDLKIIWFTLVKIIKT